jgi:hypothetical protein
LLVVAVEADPAMAAADRAEAFFMELSPSQ